MRYLCSLISHDQIAQVNNLPLYLIRNNGVPADRFFCLSNSQVKSPSIDLQASGMVFLLLAEISKETLAGGGIGWYGLLKRLEGKVSISEGIMKRWLRRLNTMGYTTAGTTRQGTRITQKGLEFLETANYNS